MSNPGPNIKFEDLKSSLQAAVEEVKTIHKADIVIALTHIGYDEDKRLAQQVSGVDIYVGGHSHSLLLPPDSPEYPWAVGPYPTLVTDAGGALVYVVTAKCYTLYAGALRLTWDPQRRAITNVVPAIYHLTHDPAAGSPPYFPDCPKVAQLVEMLGKEVGEYEQVIVGSSKVALSSDGLRQHESVLGSLVAESMLFTLQDSLSIKADAALVNSGGIRISLPKGDISIGDVMALLPFSNAIDVLKATGRDIVLALEHGVTYDSQSTGRFPQIANLRFTWCPKAQPGLHITSAHLLTPDGDRKDLLGAYKDTTFLLATPNFLSAGGDGYAVLTGLEALLRDGPDLASGFIDFLEAMSPLDGELDGRISIACPELLQEYV